MLPKVTLQITPGDEPLLGRVPTHDESGKALSDLILLVPGFRDRSLAEINHALQEVYKVLEGYSGDVIFAEFNIKRNLLWVTVRPVRGIRVAIANAVRAKLPEAKLISHM